MPPWFRQPRGIALAALYGLLTLGGLALSTRAAVVGRVPVDGTVPPFVYLYGFLGAMAYAFTSIVRDRDKPFGGLVRVGVRAFAALPLAAGVYLVSGLFAVDRGPMLLAGLAFIAGLYVNLALNALGGIADRLYRGFTDPASADGGDASGIASGGATDGSGGATDGSGTRSKK